MATTVAPSIDSSSVQKKLAMPVTRVLYPSRLERVLILRNIATVGELVKLEPREVMMTYACGAKTMQETSDALYAFLGVTWAVARRISEDSE